MVRASRAAARLTTTTAAGVSGVLAVAVAGVSLLLLAHPSPSHAGRLPVLDDAQLIGDLHDLREEQDNRVRPDAPGLAPFDELLLVHVLLRHGDRTPDKPTYKTDPYANFSYPPIGLGGLTPAGKRTEYGIGKALLRRYGAFLGEYRANLIYSRTTDWPRTKDSMALVLAGLFPPTQRNLWDENLGAMWTPIASESTPRDEDKLLYMWDAPCPAYDRLYKCELESTGFQKHFKGSNAHLISYLEKNAGSKINSPSDVYDIYQALLSQKGFNLTLPAWADEVFPEKMKPLTALYFELDTYNRKMQRLRAGPLLKRMVRQSVAKGRGVLQPPERKMYLYAAHDNNVSALLRALRVWQPSTVPPYGTTVILEVRRRAGRVGVQLFLRNTTNPESDELHPLRMPDCEHFCPIYKFVQLTADVVPDDWDAECLQED